MLLELDLMFFSFCCYLQIIGIDDKSELLEFSLKNIEKKCYYHVTYEITFYF